eukprot:6186873-Pleurochrysis_carterae.AAC.2
MRLLICARAAREVEGPSAVRAQFHPQRQLDGLRRQVAQGRAQAHAGCVGQRRGESARTLFCRMFERRRAQRFRRRFGKAPQLIHGPSPAALALHVEGAEAACMRHIALSRLATFGRKRLERPKVSV